MSETITILESMRDKLKKKSHLVAVMYHDNSNKIEKALWRGESRGLQTALNIVEEEIKKLK